MPNTAFKVLALLKAQGVDIKPLLGKLGINVDEVMKIVGEQSLAKTPSSLAPVDEKGKKP